MKTLRERPGMLVGNEDALAMTWGFSFDPYLTSRSATRLYARRARLYRQTDDLCFQLYHMIWLYLEIVEWNMEQVECWMLCLVYTRKPAIVSEHFLNRMLKTIAHLLSELEVDMQNRDAFVSLFENTKCAVELQFEDQKLQHLLDVMLLIGCRIELELHQTGKKEFSQGDLDEIKALQSGLYEELPFSIPVTAGWL